MNCPRCTVELNEISYRGVMVDLCQSCRGLWLDQGELGKLKEKNYDSAHGLGEGRAEPSSGRISCPGDTTPMSCYHYAYSTSIIIDRCPECGGIWLDRGELEAIAQTLDDYRKRFPEEFARWSPKLEKIEKKWYTEQERMLDDLVPVDFLFFDDILRFCYRMLYKMGL